MNDIGGLSPAKRALLEHALAQRRQAAAATTAIPRRRERGPAPLSHSQQRMWFLQQWEPDSPTFNGVRAIRLLGRLDIEALVAGLRTVTARHESLRTVVAGESDPRQVVLEEWSLEVPVLALDDSAPREREGKLQTLLRDLARQPFALDRDLMVRATIIKLGPEEHVLLIRMHHIAADAHSDRVLFAELSELYNAALAGRAARLPELPIQYSDFAVWQRERLQGARLQELVGYWKRQLDGAPALLRLPADLRRPPVQRHRGAHLALSLPRAVVEPLVTLARGEGVTFYISMLAVFAALLYRISGESDVVIGSPIANRNHLELQGLIGFFTNTLALRVRLDGNPSFRTLLSRSRETALGGYAHQDLPFEKVVEALAPKRDPSYNPLFQVNFRAQATERPALGLAGLRSDPIAVDIGFSRFDLALELELGEQALSGYFEYDEDLFTPATIAELVEDLEALLIGICTDCDAPLLELQLPHGRRGAGRRAVGRTIGRRVSRSS